MRPPFRISQIAERNGESPLWIISGHFAVQPSCLLCRESGHTLGLRRQRVRVMRQSVAVCSLAQRAARFGLWPSSLWHAASPFRSRRGLPPRTTHRLAVAWCPVYLLRSRLPSLAPGMPSHSPCSVYCQSHHCGNVAFGQLGVPDVYCASQSRYCDSSELRLSPSCSFSTWL